MPGCHRPRPAARRPFVITAYTAGEDGVLVPAMPAAGPCGERYARACLVVVDHVRKRSTGPCFPLTVVRCGTHRTGFTLYPPGHVPYGRIGVVPDLGSSADGPAGMTAFAGTMFDAALDAARGQGWPRECPGGSDRWWGTQGRRLERSIRACGVSPQLPEPEREAAAAALQVDLLLLRDGARELLAVPGYRSRGRVVCLVLERLSQGPCIVERLMRSGHLAGLWGPPFWWDPEAAQLRRLWFRGPGTDPP